MRKLKLTPLFLLASVFGLSACTLPSWLSFLSFIPGLEAPEKEEKEEEKKEEEEEEEEEKVVYDAEKVATDFNAALADEGYSFAAEWDDDYDEYYLGVSFGASTDESEANLKSAAETLASFLPEYVEKDFEVYGDPTSESYYDLFGDQSYYYYMSFVTSDEAAEIYVVSYVYNGSLVAAIEIMDAEAE